jgi:hypothetical protein
MPDRTTLKVGDRIRLLRVPEADSQQRERELREGAEMPGWTAKTIEQILAHDPVVTISRIDEYGYPWFDYELQTPSDGVHFHSLAIMEGESWSVE